MIYENVNNSDSAHIDETSDKEVVMQQFHNILFVSRGTGDETESLKQALSLARNNQVPLEVLVVSPEFPADLADYEKAFQDSLAERVKKSIQVARTTLNLGEADRPINVKFESGGTPAIRIVRHVLRNAHDLVVKGAEPAESSKGFKAMDMELLRKCPCPVWLSRPIERSRDNIRVAVAIDPQSGEQAGHDLARRLLQLSRSLADTCSGELSIISCWDYPLEEYLRGNVWIKMSEGDLHKTVMDAQARHGAELEALIRESDIGGKYHRHHVRGRPDQLIPTFIEDKKIDILVMGTVARTGIPSFTMGNTAENVLQKVSCSLLAVKPNGFISSVRAY